MGGRSVTFRDPSQNGPSPVDLTHIGVGTSPPKFYPQRAGALVRAKIPDIGSENDAIMKDGIGSGGGSEGRA